MTSSAQDKPQTIDLDPSTMLERVDNWIDGAIRMTPNIVVAVVLFALSLGISVLVRSVILRATRRRNRENLGEMLGSFAKTAVILVGALLAATIVVPSLKPGDLIAGLGVSSVAIGFAFKDILQNWLAGLLLLIRQPFEVGDQIKVNGFEGTVQRIETRATIIKTYDGQKAVIPNSQIYSESLVVKTAHDKRRSQYDFGIGYDEDIGEACKVILGVLQGLDDIESDPAPQAFAWDLAASWVSIRARWWTDTKRADIVAVKSQVVRRVKEAMDAAGIDLPFETHVELQRPAS